MTNDAFDRLEEGLRAHVRGHARISAWRRPSARLLALAAAAAAGAIIVAAMGPGRVHAPGIAEPAQAARVCLPTPTSHTVPADDCLRALALVAAAQARSKPGVRYQRNLFTSTMKGWGGALRHIGPDHHFPGSASGRYAFSLVVDEEIWTTPDGRVTVRYHDPGRWIPASTYDEVAWRAAGAPRVTSGLSGKLRWGPLHMTYRTDGARHLYLSDSDLEKVIPKTGDPLRVVPRDPAKLGAWLQRAAWRQRASHDPDCKVDGTGCFPALQRVIDETFGSDVMSLLRYPETPASLRAALLRVFARIEGTKLVGRITDPAGRIAALIQVPPGMNDGETMVAFDPRTSQLLGLGTAVAGAPGAVRWNTVYAVDETTVAKVGDRP